MKLALSEIFPGQGLFLFFMESLLKTQNFFVMKYFVLITLFFITLTQSTPGFGQSLIWSDEFNYEGLPDTTKWAFQIGGHGWGNQEWQYYTDSTNNAVVKNGSLHIIARKEKYDKWNYTSARLYTYPTGQFFKYGKIEARIKLPYGQGIWPAFWLLGVNINKISWPACGEIDVMEMIGGSKRENTVHGTLHWKKTAGNHTYKGGKLELDGADFSEAFHVFSVQWNEDKVIWYVDSEAYFELSIAGEEMKAFHKEFYMLLNLAVGGRWPGYPDETTTFPQVMEVDWVRVYKL